jgi:hypothetical protein
MRKVTQAQNPFGLFLGCGLAYEVRSVRLQI